MNDIVDVVKNAVDGKTSWNEIQIKYPKFEQQETKSV